MNINILLSLILTFIYLFLPSTTNWAQEEELKLRLSKNFGYGTSRQMQGIFTLKASRPGVGKPSRFLYRYPGDW